MKTSIFAVVASGIVSVWATPVAQKDGVRAGNPHESRTATDFGDKPVLKARDNLPGLNAVQSDHARAIMAQTEQEGLGDSLRQGCLAGIATALVESNILVYANEAVPESLNYPHDAVGSDYDSVGIFQQRATYYPDIACIMDPACSAGQFYAGMKAVDGWRTMNVGDLCQAVQKSAFPDRYAEQVPLATDICAAGGL